MSSSSSATGCRSPSRSSNPRTASSMRASRHSVATTRGRAGSSSSAARRGRRLGTSRAIASPVGPTSAARVSSETGASRRSSAALIGA